MQASQTGLLIKYKVPEHIQDYNYVIYGTNWKCLTEIILWLQGKKEKSLQVYFYKQTNKQKKENLWTSIVLTTLSMFYTA